MSLTILTLTWNACDKLTKLHDSLIPSLEGVNFKWLIKDNASKDDTIAVASTWGNNVQVIPYHNNSQNFSQGMNYLFDVARPANDDFIMLLNNDVVFNDIDSIKKMIAIIENDKSVGMVGARLLYTGTNNLQHAGVVFNPTYKTPMHFRAGQTSDIDAENNRTFQVVTGAVAITKAEYFRNANTNNASGYVGLDEKFFWAFDDVDLCLSIHHNMKKKIVYCGGTNISHEESASLKKNPINKLMLKHNLNHLFTKWKDRYSIDQDIYTKDPKHNLY